MKVGDICIRNTVFVTEEASVQKVARLMAEYHIGSVVVIRETGDGKIPVGIVTDRDIALSMVIPNRDGEKTTVDEVMSHDLITMGEDEDMFETLRHMRIRGVRRMPVVDSEGLLCGIVSIDDILAQLTDEMKEIIRLFRKETINE